MSINTEAPLLEARNLKKYFKTPRGTLHAVDDVSLSIQKGSTLGVVGESGCGKSTLGRTVLRLLEPTAGDVLYNGESILGKNEEQMREMRKKMQIIFQDPYASLNPRMNVSQLIAEPMRVCKTLDSESAIQDKVRSLMKTVGLAERLIKSYPHELDGGRRQRIGVARALALDPEFIVCDEPVSALDVSIQAQILNLMMDLQEERGLTYMFITHNLSVVKHISNQIAVMYLGQCVEWSDTEEIFAKPYHPYTQSLLAAIPIASASECHRDIVTIQGEVSSPINPKSGCRFAPRCPEASQACVEGSLPLRLVSGNHWVACRLYE